IPPLAFLAIVDAGRMIAADPLTPTVQVKTVVPFMAGEVGVTDEPHVCLKAGLSQGLTQPADACGDAARPRIVIRPLEGQKVELHRSVLRRTPFRSWHREISAYRCQRICAASK